MCVTHFNVTSASSLVTQNINARQQRQCVVSVATTPMKGLAHTPQNALTAKGTTHLPQKSVLLSNLTKI